MGDVHVHEARRFSKEIQRKRSLLEKLRDNKNLLVDGNPNDNPNGPASIPNKKEERQRMAMKLMIEHELEFPFHLRPAIRKAVACWPNEPSIFLSEVYNAFRAFFLGQSFGTETDSNPEASESESESDSDPDLDTDTDSDSDTETELPIEWHGLDSDFDTEDQVEVALRFFPRLLKELLLRNPHANGNWNALIPWRTVDHEVSPMEVLFSQARAVSFLPLFLTVRKELGLPLSMFFVAKQLLVPGKATFAKLYGTVYARALFGSHPRTTEQELERLDNESLLALVRIQEMGLWKVENDADSLLKWLLSNAQHRERCFIEARLRLMIDWKPSMLRDLRRTLRPPPDEVHPRPLLELFSFYFSMVDDETYRLGIFEMMVDLGMSHFPMELGFVFHSCILPSFSERHGKEPIFKIVHDRLQILLRSLGHNHKTLQSLVIAVATNNRIRLDGLYTLLRSNPVVLMPHHCNETGTDS